MLPLYTLLNTQLNGDTSVSKIVLVFIGYSRRTRNVFGNSISCNPNVTLNEERRCNTHPCGQYSLRSGAWSRCYAKDIQRGCGAGQQWRNITCFKISGPEVPLQYCIEELYGGKMTLNFEVCK